MAHGREGPDLVMTVRYAGASEVRSVSGHEKDRVPDGSSAIDPARSHLNQILHGPGTQFEALEQLWQQGVRKPAAQAEKPFVQLVLSASPSFFRGQGQGPGQWDQDRLDSWLEATMRWLRSEYGDDLAHVALHQDEDTPHLHVLVVPTYSKKPRVPGRKKRGESDEDFALRKLEAISADTVRTAGRASSEYWSNKWARRDARKSYHTAVQHLGIGYGRDFVEDGDPSPRHKTTGNFVREEAARLRDLRNEIEAESQTIISDAIEKAAVITSDAEHFGHQVRSELKRRENSLEIKEREVIDREEVVAKKELQLSDAQNAYNEKIRIFEDQRKAVENLTSQAQNVLKVLKSVAGRVARVLDFKLTDWPEFFRKSKATLDEIEQGVQALPHIEPIETIETSSAAEDPFDEPDAPGLGF